MSMRPTFSLVTVCGLIATIAAPTAAQNAPARADTLNDTVKILAARLDLDRYKATIKGLTQFGAAGSPA